MREPDAALINDAHALIDAGRYDDAVPLLRAGVEHALTSTGSDSIEAATAFNTLGVACKFAGRYEEAAAAYARALPVAEACARGDPELLCALLHNLGGLAHSQGDDVVAETYARRGLALREAHACADTAIAADTAALGAILEGLERWDESEALYRRALAVWERQGDAYEVGMTLNGLAAVVRFSGRPGDAEPLFCRSLALIAKARGPRHPDTATVRNNLAMLLNATGRAAQALPLLTEAAADLEVMLGADHPATVDVLRNRDRVRASLLR